MDTPGSPVHSQPRSWQLGCTWVLATSQQKIHQHFYLNPVSEASQESKSLQSVLAWGYNNLLQSKFFCREADHKGSQGCSLVRGGYFFSYLFSHICWIETQAIPSAALQLQHSSDPAHPPPGLGTSRLHRWMKEPGVGTCAGSTSNPRQFGAGGGRGGSGGSREL